MKMSAKKRDTKIHEYFSGKWRVLITRREARTDGVRSWPRVVHWYAYPIGTTTRKLGEAVHTGGGGIHRAEEKLRSLYPQDFA
jgi:hypothetical protein